MKCETIEMQIFRKMPTTNNCLQRWLTCQIFHGASWTQRLLPMPTCRSPGLCCGHTPRGRSAWCSWQRLLPFGRFAISVTSPLSLHWALSWCRPATTKSRLSINSIDWIQCKWLLKRDVLPLFKAINSRNTDWKSSWYINSVVCPKYCIQYIDRWKPGSVSFCIVMGRLRQDTREQQQRQYRQRCCQRRQHQRGSYFH